MQVIALRAAVCIQRKVRNRSDYCLQFVSKGSQTALLSLFWFTAHETYHEIFAAPMNIKIAKVVDTKNKITYLFTKFIQYEGLLYFLKQLKQIENFKSPDK